MPLTTGLANPYRTVACDAIEKTMNLDWRNILPVNGSRPKAFEKLCVQLADSEKPAGAKFVPTGDPDAGVECYAVLSDGSEWCWQAKYFLGPLRAPQWRQLDDSVKTVLDKHPALACYFVCAPLDLPDARVPGQTSARQRWELRVVKWQGWAQKRGIDVEFVWWGEHELTNILTKPLHTGRRQFWFGQIGLDQDWFQRRINELVPPNYPRYTPEIHVDLPIAHKFELFGRTESSLDEIKSLARGIRRRLSSLANAAGQIEGSDAVAALDGLEQTANAVLAELASLEPMPNGTIPLRRLAETANSAIEVASGATDILSKLENNASRPRAGYHGSPVERTVNDIRYLISALHQVESASSEADVFANSGLVFLKGDAGSGKTHLLCDLGKRRIEAQAPTVLLMGQRFTEQSEPWQQALQQLHLPGASAEGFVGALEAAAQAYGKRALFVIDAVNEGRGREIWPSHLSAFLAPLIASPWIGVVISVRSTYADAVIPEDVRESATAVTHEGFAGHEYDALTTFFEYYGLELSSTPIINPEFQNPLFLKTLCRGLQLRGETRLPRGFHGITQTFDMYLDAVNQSLAKALDYNPSDQLVKQALSSVARAMHETWDQWLPSLPRYSAENLVNELLPGRPFSTSLYRGLVNEGLLYVDMLPHRAGLSEEIVHISYERFADHTIAGFLLDQYLEVDDPDSAFGVDGGLAFMRGESGYFRQGLLEAMSIQIPERIGSELIEFAPTLQHRFGFWDTFLQSIVWRRTDAFSRTTTEIVNNLLASGERMLKQDALETLLTVAVIEDHPLNADFLDQMLRQDAMPGRDAWWSTYLFEAWSWGESAVHRLIQWAWEISQKAEPDDETVELCAVTLAWMLTTSHRFVRDRATKALVNLLTGRLPTARRVVERFADVDDPYVAERIYAVAYGVAMRSRDSVGVSKLAQLVYDNAFASGTPPPHLLLRDYARGVIERAVHMGADLDVDLEMVRPPYLSEWPPIPSEAEVQGLIEGPESTNSGNQSRRRGWDSIEYSVMHGDFAIYIIGTNSPHLSNHWLSVTLDEEPWRSGEERTEYLSSRLNPDERAALDEYEAARFSIVPANPFDNSVDDQDNDQASNGLLDSRQNELANVLTHLTATLSDEHRAEWEAIDEQEWPPGLDPRIAQRYILNRVIDLGWTTSRFGEFDALANFDFSYGRSANKPERIGKKYQWIAYYEFLALVADRFQYNNWGERDYVGPWQIGCRDIDPSDVQVASPDERAGYEGTRRTWWEPLEYDDWRLELPTGKWITDDSDIPEIEEGLVVSKPSETSVSWVNAFTFQLRSEPHPADIDKYDVERREIWFRTIAFMVPLGKGDDFIEWVMSGAYWEEHWQFSVPGVGGSYGVFLGEHGWSPASLQQMKEMEDDAKGWEHPYGSIPAVARMIAVTHLTEAGGYDCSIDDSREVHLPNQSIIDGCRLHWTGVGADYADENGAIAAFDPTVHENGPNALLLRTDLLELYLSEHNLELCWAVIGEKQTTGTVGQPYGWLRLQGAYVYREGRPIGKWVAEPRPLPGIDT